MPSAATRPHLSLQSSFSYSTTAFSSISGSRGWTPRIDSATIISSEKRTDQKVWYLIKIVPENHPYSPHLKSYLIAKRYQDFVQFSQKLHGDFSTLHHHTSFQLPPKIKSTRLSILASNNTQRINELNQFLFLLFQNPVLITESQIVVDFFDVLDQDLKYKDTKQEVASEEETLVDDDSRSTKTSKWKRLRCSSFLARAPQPSASLSSLCNQAASKIMPSRHRSSSMIPSSSSSTKEILKKSKSSTCIDAKQLKDTIKIKVIYDVNNIIVVQVPRSIALDDLRSRIAKKFSDSTCTQNEIVLLYNDSYCNSSLPAILIKKEQDLAHIMRNKWHRLEKVTLRCIM